MKVGHIIESAVDVKKGTLLAAILPLLGPLCGECGKLLAGEVSLTKGVLNGLSKIMRSGPVVMDWQDGAVKLMAGLKVPGMTAPFSGSASVRDMEVNPEINTRVQDVGVDFGFQVPVTGGSWMADYDLKLGNVDVDFGGLGALGELADLISPKVGDLVGEKIRELMEGDVKNFLVREMEKRIPDIKSIVS